MAPEVEVAFLGSLFSLDPLYEDRIDRALEILPGPAAFTTQRRRDIFQAVVALRERGDAPDVPSVADELRRRGRLDRAGGIEYLADLVDVGTPPTAETQARALADHAHRRRVARAAEEVIDLAGDAEQSPDEIVSAARAAFDRLESWRARNELRSLADVWEESLPAFLDPDPFLLRPSDAGLGREMDRLLGGGLTPGQTATLVAWGAGRGKTTLAHQWVDGQARANSVAYAQAKERGETPVVVPILFVSEMSEKDLTLRSLARQAGVEGSLLRDPRGPAGSRPLADGTTYGSDALMQAHPAAEAFWDAARFLTVLDRSTRVTVAALEEAVRRIRRRWEAEGCDVPAVLVVVDPVHRLLDPTRSEVEALGVTLLELMDLAQRTEAIVLFTSDTTKAAVYGRGEAAGKETGEKLAESAELAFRGSYLLLHLPDVALGLMTLSAGSEALSDAESVRLEQEPPGTHYAEVVDAKSRWADRGIRAGFLYDPALFRFRPTSARELSGEFSLADRILRFVESNPLCSENRVRNGVTGRDEDIRATIHELLRAGKLVDEGTNSTGRKLRIAGTTQGTRPEQPPEQPPEQGEGHEVVPGGSSYKEESPPREQPPSHARRAAQGESTTTPPGAPAETNLWEGGPLELEEDSPRWIDL